MNWDIEFESAVLPNRCVCMRVEKHAWLVFSQTRYRKAV